MPDLLPFPSQIRLADSCIRLDTGNKNVHPLQSWSFYNETVSSDSSDNFSFGLGVGFEWLADLDSTPMISLEYSTHLKFRIGFFFNFLEF